MKHCEKTCGKPGVRPKMKSYPQYRRAPPRVRAKPGEIVP
ncbi:hypothetical protein HMPREF0742_01278 [Rothia aeria F0184]|uniref:Uncharacterized protein n=1 Tax=Rothia aeria F0184 TaxID=888019 RepID=U7V3W3_9MICC|nr:hypothetical protein HMPREF0742_01278 [Rothia aeria F0184]